MPLQRMFAIGFFAVHLFSLDHTAFAYAAYGDHWLWLIMAMMRWQYSPHSHQRRGSRRCRPFIDTSTTPSSKGAPLRCSEQRHIASVPKNRQPQAKPVIAPAFRAE